MALVFELAPDQCKIMFEITESAATQNVDEADGVIRMLRRLGHPLCLDNFDAGFSAFTYLRPFEVDFVTLDGTFLNAACNRPRDAALVKSVTQLCRDRHCATIGEMSENQTEAKAAQTLGVNFGQGYYFSKPGATPKYARVHLRIFRRPALGAGTSRRLPSTPPPARSVLSSRVP
jgi:EAL domain-containing protein (putative c-di-GMP-specific phosphodiesterase class I)